MSQKINIVSIIKSHIKTLRSADTSTMSYSDIITFFIIPLILAYGIVWADLHIDEHTIFFITHVTSIIFVFLAFLLFIHKNQNKENRSISSLAKAKTTLHNEMNDNVCYSVLIAIISIMLDFIFLIFSLSVENNNDQMHQISFILVMIKFLILPLILFLFIHLLLTTIMIIKRSHILLK